MRKRNQKLFLHGFKSIVNFAAYTAGEGDPSVRLRLNMKSVYQRSFLTLGNLVNFYLPVKIEAAVDALWICYHIGLPACERRGHYRYSISA